MRLAVVGATGMVGTQIFRVLEELDFHFDELVPVASERSIGRTITCKGKEYKVVGLSDAVAMRPDLAIFSAGKDVSLEWAPKFAETGTYVVDNSSAWRMYPDKKLIVPEVNISELTADDHIIANPNCSTIQLMVALAPLKKYGLKRLVISTYQSVSGSGFKGVNQLMCEREGKPVEKPAYPHQIDLNCLPHGGAFLENGYTEEEMKLVNESRKILGLPHLLVTSTVVRVPVVGGHSEAVNVEFEQQPDLEKIMADLKAAPGLVVQDDPKNNLYPMAINAKDKNETFVGRIRLDYSCKNAINMWVVADNLRKGAATNAVQIAQYVKDKFVTK
ncbi:MAG: aspartate-semialdehyde dehydrogenase [Bacteroidales bacterium]|nr:aspartate-semialdehyde dehydrogenase [Bacteroidales bacterium]